MFFITNFVTYYAQCLYLHTNFLPNHMVKDFSQGDNFFTVTGWCRIECIRNKVDVKDRVHLKRIFVVQE